MERRVFVSAHTNGRLDDRRRQLKAAILAKIRAAGLAPQEFFESGIAEDLPWNFANTNRVMRQCIGAVVFGFPRWVVSTAQGEQRLAGEFNHFEGAMALTYDLPLLLLKEEGVEDRGVVWSGMGKAITYVPETAEVSWVEGEYFAKRFAIWLRALETRKDVFLAYCSKSSGIAAQIQIRLERQGASVLNWAMDFRAGGSILSEIENARSVCSCGIFLFSEDDPLDGLSGEAAPRDNVVFEAGYFMSSKGPDRCLIIRSGDARMPADVGGSIYVHLARGADVSTIESQLRDFLTRNL